MPKRLYDLLDFHRDWRASLRDSANTFAFDLGEHVSPQNVAELFGFGEDFGKIVFGVILFLDRSVADSSVAGRYGVRMLRPVTGSSRAREQVCAEVNIICAEKSGNRK